MRYTFGGTPADGLIQAPSANGNVHKSLPNLSGGTFWSAQVGGTQYADLVATGTDPTPITTDGDGYVRPFQGPDGVEGGWVDFGGGRRYLKGREVGTLATFDPAIANAVNGTSTQTRAALDGRYAKGTDLAAKADTTALASKADASTVTAKADKSYVDAQLGASSKVRTGALPTATAATGPTFVGNRRVTPGVDSRYAAFPCTTLLPDGRLFMVWREGTDHVNTHDGIVRASYSSDNGLTWTAATTIATDASNDLRDPAVTCSADGTRLWLTYFKATSTLAAAGGFVRTSLDSGATWGAEVRIDSKPYAALCSPILELSDGRLLAAWYGKDATGDAFDSSYVAISTDKGATWGAAVKVVNGVTDGRDYQEPWPVRSGNTVQLFFRYGNASSIGRAVSTDNAATWSGASSCFAGTGRPCTVWSSSGPLTVVYRSTSGAGDGMTRSSRDGGATWEKAKLVEPAAPNFWTYSGPVEVARGVIFCPSAVEASSTSSKLSARYLMHGSGASPFGDLIPDRRLVIANRIDQIVVADSFDRADASTPGTAPTGQTWTTSGGTPISSGAIVSTTVAANVAWVDSGTSNLDIEADMAWVSNSGVSLVFRRSAAGDFLFATTETSGTAFRLYKMVGGVATQLGTATATTVAGQYHTFRVRAVGSYMQVYLDDVRLFTVTDSTNQAETGVGIRVNPSTGATHYCRRFVCRSF